MRKYIFYITIFLFLNTSNFLFAQVNRNEVHVKSYINNNGTFIQSHQRTAPNSTNSDNFSTKGNVNPYTGKPGWVNSDNGNANNNYEIDTAKLDYEKNHDFQDYLMKEKISKIFDKELEEKYSNSKQTSNYINENEEYFVDENVTENKVEENRLPNSIMESENNDSNLNKNNTSSQNNLYCNYKIDKNDTKIGNNEKSKLNNDKFIFPIVIILSIIILFIRAKIK